MLILEEKVVGEKASPGNLFYTCHITCPTVNNDKLKINPHGKEEYDPQNYNVALTLFFPDDFRFSPYLSHCHTQVRF